MVINRVTILLSFLCLATLVTIVVYLQQSAPLSATGTAATASLHHRVTASLPKHLPMVTPRPTTPASPDTSRTTVTVSGNCQKTTASKTEKTTTGTTTTSSTTVHCSDQGQDGSSSSNVSIQNNTSQSATSGSSTADSGTATNTNDEQFDIN